MKGTLLVLAVLLVSTGVQAKPWDPGRPQLPLWPGTPPDGQPVVMPEDDLVTVNQPVGGKPWLEVDAVVHPTMTVYSPTGASTGAAVVVFPGGGYQILAIDLEGTEICDWLTAKGITCVLSKYRVPGTRRYPKTSPHWRSGPYPQSPIALEDAQRTISLVRFHAAEWHIDSKKIGVIGFSAGGHLVAATSTHRERVYRRVDAADEVSPVPDFAIALYPGHLSLEKRPHELNPDIRPTADTPPTFIVQAEDDPVDDVENSLVYFAALKKAKAPVELHIFAHGGHAFGLRRTKEPITRWTELVEAWLGTIGVLK